MDRTHNPEFTAMEIYVAYKDYNWMMEFTENLLEHCAVSVNGKRSTLVKTKLALKRPMLATMTDSIKHFTGFDISGKTEAELFAAARGIEVDETMGKGKLIDEIFAKCEGIIFNPHLLLIIRRKCHHFVKSTVTTLD
jgi:lysyl-tRNA synthetase class 2